MKPNWSIWMVMGPLFLSSYGSFSAGADETKGAHYPSAQIAQIAPV